MQRRQVCRLVQNLAINPGENMANIWKRSKKVSEDFSKVVVKLIVYYNKYPTRGCSKSKKYHKKLYKSFNDINIYNHYLNLEIWLKLLQQSRLIYFYLYNYKILLHNQSVV